MSKMLKGLWAHPVHKAEDAQLSQLKEMGIGEIISITDINNSQLISLIKDSPSDEESLHKLAIELLEEAQKRNVDFIIQPGGSPAFIFILGKVISSSFKIKVLFSHSERNSKEEIQKDGSVKKVSIFQHKKWIKC